MKTVATPKGTILPLLQLKGKDYLQVAHRLVWFNEVEKNFNVEVNFPLLTDTQTIANVKVTVLDQAGNVVKSATATKRETKSDFSDHTEKAETGAIGRALALLGYGTQFAIADLDEGDRLADAPVTNTRTAFNVTKADAAAPLTTTDVAAPAQERKLSTFRKKGTTETTAPVAATTAAPAAKSNGWT